jgi:hypothetical protein
MPIALLTSVLPSENTIVAVSIAACGTAVAAAETRSMLTVDRLSSFLLLVGLTLDVSTVLLHKRWRERTEAGADSGTNGCGGTGERGAGGGTRARGSCGDSQLRQLLGQPVGDLAQVLAGRGEHAVAVVRVDHLVGGDLVLVLRVDRFTAREGVAACFIGVAEGGACGRAAGGDQRFETAACGSTEAGLLGLGLLGGGLGVKVLLQRGDDLRIRSTRRTFDVVDAPIRALHAVDGHRVPAACGAIVPRRLGSPNCLPAPQAAGC